ncbi:capsule assembly Wzi family protein [Bacteroidota bacterium]
MVLLKKYKSLISPSLPLSLPQSRFHSGYARKLITTGIISLSLFSAYSQITWPEVEVYAGGAASTGETKPFWNVNNQYGKYSLDPFEGIAGVKLIAEDTSETWFKVNYGLEIYDRLGKNNTFNIHQGYIQVATPYLTLWGGRKEDIIGNQDSLLSIGSTVWSRNAMPMPKLVMETPGYIDVPFTKGYLEISGALAHGWFEKDRYVTNAYMHHKHLHARVGGDFFINASLGLIHFAQWGGTSSNPNYGELPSDFTAFTKVFVADPGDSTSTPVQGEMINSLGNHLGSRDYRIDLKFERFKLALYYQTIFEDGTGLSKEFFKDNIKGITIKSNDPDRLVNHVVIEFLHSTFQSGPYHIISLKMKGNDNYFNNYVYRSGWTYQGMTLGTPLITSPIYNDSDDIGVYNNRVMATYIGIGGQVKEIKYRMYITTSRNLGTFQSPINPIQNQFSWYLETTVPNIWKGIDLNVMLAADIGKMYGNGVGVNILVRKQIF